MYARVQLHLEEGDDPDTASFTVGGVTLTAHGGPDGQGIGLCDIPVKPGQSLSDAETDKAAADKKAAADAKKADKPSK